MTYAEDRINEKQIISEITEQIALAMGWEVIVDPQPLSDRAIIKKDEKSLYFRLDWKDKTRLNISGGFEDCNQYLPYEREKTEITVSKDKPVERIVKDIQNRLLPGYERMLAYALERKAREDEYLAKKKVELEEIAGLIKESTIKDDEVYTWKNYLSCKFRSHGEWDLKALLFKEKLIKILAIINED